MFIIDLRELLDRLANKDTSYTYDPATDSLEAIRDYIASVVGPGLCLFGEVTNAIGATSFAADSLAGFEDDAFIGQTPWFVFPFRVAGGGAPEGEYQPVSDYVSVTGTFTHSAFTVNLTTGDYVMIIHGSLIGSVAGAFDGKLWYDQNNGVPGTNFPIGTAIMPSDTLGDLQTLCARLKFFTIMVRGSLTMDRNMEGYEFIGHMGYSAGDTIVANNKDLDGSIFRDLNITGTFAGTSMHTFDHCMFVSPVNCCGLFRECGFYEAQFRDNVPNDLYSCFAFQQEAAFDFAGGNTDTRFYGWKGAMEVHNVTGGQLDIFCDSGARVELLASCTGGIINIYGGAEVVDSSGGSTVNIYMSSGGGGAEGLVYLGEVTSVTDATHFVAADDFKDSSLFTFGNDFFVGWYAMALWDAGGAGAAPQGEYRVVTDSAGATGTITHAAFSANLAASDKVLLIHPMLFKTLMGAQSVNASWVRGAVLSITDANNFESLEFVGYGDDFFVGWWAFVLWDAGGAGAAPQGEYQQVTDYDSATGQITHGAFTANVAATDEVLLIHPALYEVLTIRGGAGTIQSILDEWDNELDLVRSADSGDYVMDGTEITLYEESAATPFQFCGAYIDWTGLNAGGGENTAVKMYVKIESGGTYRKIYEETFLAIAVPDPVCTPVPRDINTQCVPGVLYNVYGVKITATQAAVGGGWNTIPIEIFDAKK